jgi:hypothetical protein
VFWFYSFSCIGLAVSNDLLGKEVKPAQTRDKRRFAEPPTPAACCGQVMTMSLYLVDPALVIAAQQATYRHRSDNPLGQPDGRG